MAAVNVWRVRSLDQRAFTLLRRGRWISAAMFFRRHCFRADVGSTAEKMLLTSSNTGIWSSVVENQYKQQGINPGINVVQHN